MPVDHVPALPAVEQQQRHTDLGHHIDVGLRRHQSKATWSGNDPGGDQRDNRWHANARGDEQQNDREAVGEHEFLQQAAVKGHLSNI